MPLIITAAITGAETRKSDQPNLPIMPDEQGLAAKQCMDAGASIIHLHVRDKMGLPTQDINAFRASMDAIRNACGSDIIIQISTGGAIGENMQKRVQPIIELQPDMASLNVASMNFGNDIFLNHPADVNMLACHIKENNIIPEIECYDVGHITIAKKIACDGRIRLPMHYQFVLGVPGGISATNMHLEFMRSQLSDDDMWGVAAVGRQQLPMAVIAMTLGGHVRVGFEDNIFYRKGELAKNNAQLVARISRISGELDRPVASCLDAREIIGLK